MKIEDLFAILENEEDFQQLDRMLTKECERRLAPICMDLPSSEYEQVRDVVFSIAYAAKKSSFQIGFKSAIRLLFECRDGG